MSHTLFVLPRVDWPPMAALLSLSGLWAVVGWQALSPHTPNPWVLWLLLGAPWAEEVVFRTGWQEALLRRWPAAPWRATVLTALLFAAAHTLLRPSAMALATVLPALLLGEVYRRERHWLPCAGLHALFNLMGLLWMPPWLSAAWA